MPVLHERLLQPRSEFAVPAQQNVDIGDILGGLPEIWNLAGAELGFGVEDGNRAVLAVDEFDVVVGVVGSDDDDEFSVEAEIGLHIEGVDAEIADLVGRDLGRVIRPEKIPKSDEGED